MLLSALGIAIGVSAMVAVVGVSVSSKAELNRRLEALGTNLLRVSPAPDLRGEAGRLPPQARSMVSRIGPVTSAAAIGELPTGVYRNDHIPAGRTGSLTVQAAEPGLRATVGATIRRGVWFNPATERYPTVVLGATAAERLGITEPGTRVWIGARWCTVIGVLAPVPLVPELDGAALVSWPAAERYLGFDGRPTTVYVRAAERDVLGVAAVLPRSANPEHPEEVAVARPSDALTAKVAADSTLTSLLVGLGAVALLVGGIGVGNTMIISVIERRSEIGLRRSLGATRSQIRNQFLTESLLVSALGGVGGAVLGTVITGTYAVLQGWPTVVPPWASGVGVAATLVIGSAAGLYPAVRAGRLPPTVALAAA